MAVALDFVSLDGMRAHETKWIALLVAWMFVGWHLPSFLPSLDFGGRLAAAAPARSRIVARGEDRRREKLDCIHSIACPAGLVHLTTGGIEDSSNNHWMAEAVLVLIM